MRHTRQPLDQESGSAMVLVLMVSLLLSVLGMGLIFATELEMQLGGTERVITNNFYAAESGVHAGIAAVMVTQDWGGEKFAIVEGSSGTGYLIGHRVVTSRLQAVGPPQAPPLSVANEGEDDFHSFSVIMSSSAQRVSWPDADPAPIYESGDTRENAVTIQAQSLQTVRYFLSPLRTPSSPGEIYNSSEAVAVN